MAKKMYPVQRSFPLILDGSPDTNATIRIDKCLSLINHRLYRQSRMYHAKIDLDANAPAGTEVTVWALANTWFGKKAYQLAYEAFLENSKEERDQLGASSARWNDFRVDTGLGTTFQKDMIPSGNTSPTATPGGYDFGTNGEYLMSEVHDAAGVRHTFAWSGAGSATEFNIITQYDVAGNTNATPSNTQNSVAYDDLSDERDDGQVEHLSNDGNLPPYNRNVLETNVWIKVATLHVAAGGTQRLSTGFFEAPCGLVAITSTTPMTQDSTILNLEVKGGDYKGVGAPTYLDEGRIFASSKTSSGASHNKRIR